MVFLRMGTGNEGIQSLDPVGKAVGCQKVERPVGDRRLRAHSLISQDFEDIIGPHGLVLLKQDLKHTASNWRQLQPLGRTAFRNCIHRVRDAMGVIVLRKANRLHGGLI